MALCNLCPRRCNADAQPTGGEGYCRMGTLPVVARAAAHLWEEPCISGTRGSGTVFFSGCALGCVFCQNESISHHSLGRAMDARALSELFARVEELGVHNLNLVTPSHFAPVIFEALRLRRPGIPVVWNSSGYETVETGRRPPPGAWTCFCRTSSITARKPPQQLAGAPDYFPVAMAAIRAMCQAKGAPVYDADGLMQSGTLVRHLILPLRTSESLRILDADRLGAAAGHAGEPDAAVHAHERRQPSRPGPAADRPGNTRACAITCWRWGWRAICKAGNPPTAAFTPAFMDEESTRLSPSVGMRKN